MSRRRTTSGVRVEKAGLYYIACWVDSSGKKRRAGLDGARTIAQARQRAEVLARKLILAPRLRDMGRAPGLKAWLERYLEQHATLRDSTRELVGCTGGLLRAKFGDDRAIDAITRADAKDWRTWLGKRVVRGSNPTEATIRKHLRHAKAIFAWATRQDLIPFNPFDREPSSVQRPSKTWAYLDADATTRLLDAAPGGEWRALIGLCRWAGLRRGEALALTWDRVDWDRKVIRVYGRKTDTFRTVPMRPELHDVLLAWHETKGKPIAQVVPLSVRAVEQQLESMIDRAGIAGYAKPLHTLRKNAESDWLAEFPFLDVVEWMGHSPTVAATHYHQVLKRTEQRAVGNRAEKASVLPQTASKHDSEPAEAGSQVE